MHGLSPAATSKTEHQKPTTNPTDTKKEKTGNEQQQKQPTQGSWEYCEHQPPPLPEGASWAEISKASQSKAMPNQDQLRPM